MSQIIKTYMGLSLIFVMLSVSILILNAFLTTADAINFHARVITELEESNFAPAVMTECINQAEEKKYQLTLTAYGSSGEMLESSGANTARDPENPVAMVKVKLVYSLGLMGKSGVQDQVISGYAR